MHICFYFLINSIFLFSSATSHVAFPKDKNPFAIAVFIGGRKVEGNSNTLSNLYFEGRSDGCMERVMNYICS